MNETTELTVTKGPLEGKRFKIGPGGMRLGRSSSCEISVKDPALSRNHCLFELRDDKVWVTDLASANGTRVNGEDLGADSRELKPGDVVSAGESELVFAADAMGEIDLGLGDSAEVERSEKPPLARIVLWVVAVLAVIGAAALILATPRGGESESVEVVSDKAMGKLLYVSYEKVEASPNGIFRSAMSYEDGELKAEIDDTAENRHADKAVKLSNESLARLDALLSDPSLYALDKEYAGTVGSKLRSCRLKIIRGDKVFATMVENEAEPEVFLDVRTKLETFAKNEMGMWSVQYSAAKLQEMSETAMKEGDLKWSERDVRHGNIALAIRSYEEAISELETVNPKPAFFDTLLENCRMAKSELDRRYRDQNFLVDRAIKLGDWAAAKRELTILCEMVPDQRDQRHADANTKLLDVEARQKEKKGVRK